MPVRETLRYLVAERALDLGPTRTARMPIVDVLCSHKGSPAQEAVVHNISHAMVWLVQHLPQSVLVATSGRATR